MCLFLKKRTIAFKLHFNEPLIVIVLHCIFTETKCLSASGLQSVEPSKIKDIMR